MIHGFLEKTKEKIEVLSKDETYTREQICSGLGRPIKLFDDQIELWIWKNVALVSVAANSRELINIDAESGFFDGISSTGDPNDYFSVFVTPRPDTTPEYNMDIKFMGYYRENYQSSGNWKGFRFMCVNNNPSPASFWADILMIKQVL